MSITVQALSQRQRPKPPLEGGRPRSREEYLLCPPSCRVIKGTGVARTETFLRYMT
jgi:hypothetical protein